MQQIDWKSISDSLQSYQLPPQPLHVTIDNIYDVIDSCYTYVLESVDKQYQRTPEIDQLAEWLFDNHHKGLFLFGKCGTGKTFFVKYILPLILKAYGYGEPSYFDMTYAVRHTDKVLYPKILVLDDVGTEQRFNDYGTIRNTLDEVVDNAEKYGNLLIITCNLTKEDLIRIYGERTYDRICAITHRILFTGNSFRQQ